MKRKRVAASDARNFTALDNLFSVDVIDDLIEFADTVTEKLNKYFNVTPYLAIVTIILDQHKKKKLTT